MQFRKLKVIEMEEEPLILIYKTAGIELKLIPTKENINTLKKILNVFSEGD